MEGRNRTHVSAHDPEMPEGEAPAGVTPRRIVWGVVLVVVLFVGLFVLISKAAGFSNVVDVLQHADISWMAACFALQVVSWAGYVVVMWGVVEMDHGVRLRPWHAFRLWLLSLGGTRIVSPAGAGGMATTYWALCRAGMRRRDALRRVFAIGILVFAVFGLLAFGASVAAAAIGPDAPPGMTLPWIIGVPLIGVWGVWFGLPGRAERVSAPRGRGWFARGLAAAATGVIVTRDVLLRPRAHTVPLLGTVGYWIFDVLSLWAAMRAVGAEVPLLGVAIGYAIGYVAMLFPLPAGGYGAIDAATTFALTALDLPLAQAFAGVVVWRAFSFWLPTVPALVALARVRDLGRVMATYRRGRDATEDPVAAA